MRRVNQGKSRRGLRRGAAIVAVFGLAGAWLITGAPPASAVATAPDHSYSFSHLLPAPFSVPAGTGLLIGATGTGALTTTPTAPVASQGGTVALATDGSFTYSPPSASFVGADTFTYTVNDAADLSTASGTVTINVTNAKPTMTGLPAKVTIAQSILVSSVISLSVDDLDGAADIAGAALSITGAIPSGLTSANFGFGGTGASRTLTINRGNLPVPNPGVTVTVRVTDPLGASNDYPFTLQIDNTAPAAQGNPTPITNISGQHTFTTGDLPFTDTYDPLQTHTITLSATSALHGTLSGACLPGSLVPCTYTPDAGYVGPVVLGYTVTDQAGGVSNTAGVILNVGVICDNGVGTYNNGVIASTAAGQTLCGTANGQQFDVGSGAAGAAVVAAGGSGATVVFSGTAFLDDITASSQQLSLNGVTTQINNISQVTINALAGDDTVTIAQPTIPFTIDGGLGNNTLNYNYTGSPPASLVSPIHQAGAQDVTYANFTYVNGNGVLILGTPAADEFPLFGALPVGTTVNGLDGGDTYDVGIGGLTSPLTITDTGATGTDVLILHGNPGNYSHGATGAYSIVVNSASAVSTPGNTVNFTGIEAVNYIADYAGSDSVLFNTAGATALYSFTGGAGYGALTVDAGGAASSVSSPVNGQQIVTIAGKQPITVNGFAAVRVINSSSGQHAYSGLGYWMVASDGGVFSFGDHGFVGSAGNIKLNKPIVGMAPTPSGNGYWLCASDGGIFTYGDAGFHGSAGAITLNQPIVGCASTPTGNGYWMVASDGGVFTYGDAGFYGSTGSIKLNKPIVGMTATPSGHGYWMVASDGGIFTFGDAGYLGSTGNLRLAKPVVGMTRTPSGRGYWMVASDGGIFTFGDAAYHGSTGAMKLNKPVVTMARTLSGQGYWLIASDGGIFSFGDAGYFGSTGGIVLNKPIVGGAVKGL